MGAPSFAPESHSILVVDDTAANRRLYGTLLKKSGFHVRTAEGGREALSLIDESIPSLVVLDYMMPEMDGIEVLKRLRADDTTARLPVVMLTASAEPDHIDMALGAGANDYITKPVNGKLLVTRLRAMIQANAHRDLSKASKRNEALVEELQEAARVQQAQLPDVPLKWMDWRMTGAVAPSGAVGGDLFDLVPSEDGCFVFLLDVSGHGTGSALVAAETRSELRHLLGRGSLKHAVETLNTHLAKRATGKYCCLAAAHLKERSAEIINAGLPPVAILRGNQVKKQIWGSGLPIGMFEDSEYEVLHLDLEGGDRIIMLSDGLTEPFGATDDAAAAIERLALWPTVDDEVPSGEALRSRIRQVTKRSAPELRDDATALILVLSGTVSEHLKLLARPDAIPRAIRWVLDQCPTWVDPSAVDHGLTEALTNAILHGSLNMGSAMRAEGEGYADYLTLAEQLPDRPGFTDRHVELRVATNSESFGVRISWEGSPCPVNEQMPHSIRGVPRHNESPETLLQTSGMGMNIIRTLFDRVVWDASGMGLEIWMQKSMAGRDRTIQPSMG